MAKLYAAEKGLIGQELAADLFQALLEHTDDVKIGYDEHGTYFEVPDEAYEKALHQAREDGVPDEDEAPAPKKRGRPRKVQNPEVQE